MKRQFAVGDIHGQFELFKKLEHHLHRVCELSADDYEIILTGDVMNGGPHSYRLFKYIQNNPKIKLITGNNDEFFFNGMIYSNSLSNNDLAIKMLGMLDASVAPSGVQDTFKDMINYYKENKPASAAESGDELCSIYFEALNKAPAAEYSGKFITMYNTVYIYDRFFKDMIYLPENKDLFETIQNSYLTGKYNRHELMQAGAAINQFGKWRERSVYYESRLDDDENFKKDSHFGKSTKDDRRVLKYTKQDIKCIAFLYSQMRELHKFFEKQPLFKFAGAGGENYVITHSGYVPCGMGEGRLSKDDEGKLLWNRGSKEGNVRKERVNGRIVLHGHVPRDENKPEDICSFENGKLAVINLDGGAKNIKPGTDNGCVIRCHELGTLDIITINGTGIINKECVHNYLKLQQAGIN